MRSPDAYAVRAREMETLARLDVERAVPRIEVAHGVGAVFIERMAIGEQDLARELLAIRAPPVLSVAEEEAPIVARLGIRLLST